ncbi:MAG: TonB-dependent receptor [Halioglobus sp.]
MTKQTCLLAPKPFTTLCTAVALATTGTWANARTLEEVVVTAQKRTQSVQDVPLSITAISAAELARAGITNTTDIVKLAPSLTFAQGNNRQNSGFSIRGVGTQVFSIGVENSVAVVIDDVSTVQAGQSLANLADIERIEVLRGPQSTLFGKSASAGLLNVVTKAPAEELEGAIEYQVTDDDQNRITASLSGPISDSVRYRVSGHWDELEGYLDNLTTGDSLNDSESKGLRGKLRWDVNADVQVDLGVYYSEDEGNCCNLTWEQLDPTAQVFGLVPGAVAPGITPSDENRDVRRDIETVSNSDNSGINGRVNAQLGEFTLTSITAADNWQYENREDVDFSDVDVFAFFTGGQINGGFASSSEVETDFVSQEFRLASPVTDTHDYLVGFYYADAETDRLFRRNIGLSILPSSWDAVASTESMALFGQFNWRPTAALEVSAGLRWNDEEIKIDYINNLDPENGAANSDDNDSELLGNISAQYVLTDDVMLYARYAQGYKGQAYNVVTGFTQNDADNPVAPETADSFELGLRSTLWDQRLQFNATLFYTEYSDYQAQNTTITPEGEFINKLRNVGELETSGLELEGIALLGENLRVNAGLTYLDTEIIEFEGAPCYAGQSEAEGCVNDVQDLEGASLPNAPGWKYYVAANYTLPLGDLPFEGFVDLSYNWQDDAHFGLANSPLTEQESYGIANLSIGITERDSGRYQVTLFVNNLADESYRNAVADIRALYGEKLAIVQNLPRDSERYFGARLRYEF